MLIFLFIVTNFCKVSLVVELNQVGAYFLTFKLHHNKLQSYNMLQIQFIFTQHHLMAQEVHKKTKHIYIYKI